MKRRNKKRHHTLGLLAGFAAALMMISGCSSGKAGYTQISQDEAMQMMKEESGYLIVDVRRPDEFAAKHITGAINVPNETITEEAPEALPDKDQMMLVYCRRGNRSKEASQKLAEMGYTNVYEFGGINTWKGETEAGE